ncbi:hypothetical protein CAI21_22210 [Alkalilimnicola ehrlichii]|uniref:hypothetical protein n=1 Tax=Alkalilimnicola ehrlichii TaxID=351052 RepID=UPI000E2E448F|nr:hypothetical protein [Alkalilimnicola ehrlichii]RFA24298.1 hypothetical protein CAI21_22210 [Alkalilimnicola ehrlichii]
MPALNVWLKRCAVLPLWAVAVAACAGQTAVTFPDIAGQVAIEGVDGGMRWLQAQDAFDKAEHTVTLAEPVEVFGGGEEATSLWSVSKPEAGSTALTMTLPLGQRAYQFSLNAAYQKHECAWSGASNGKRVWSKTVLQR